MNSEVKLSKVRLEVAVRNAEHCSILISTAETSAARARKDRAYWLGVVEAERRFLRGKGVR